MCFFLVPLFRKFEHTAVCVMICMKKTDVQQQQQQQANLNLLIMTHLTKPNS